MLIKSLFQIPHIGATSDKETKHSNWYHPLFQGWGGDLKMTSPTR